MEEKPDGEYRIIKARRFLWRTTKKLRRSKEIDGNSKRSHEETV